MSKRNREDLKLQVNSLVYGETEFRRYVLGCCARQMTYSPSSPPNANSRTVSHTTCSLGNVIAKIKQVYGLPNVCYSGTNGVLQGSGGVFYDLGSGTGKPVLAATILHDFSECVGIEYLEGLFSVSQELLGVYNDRILPKMEKRERATRKSSWKHMAPPLLTSSTTPRRPQSFQAAKCSTATFWI